MSSTEDQSPPLDLTRLSGWLADHVESLTDPLSTSLVAGGRSNLTYRITDGSGSSVILRRPPLGHVLSTAHDVVREHRILSALNSTAVPVPTIFGVCADLEIIGAPFFVMADVPGLVLGVAADGERIAPEARQAVGEDLVDVLVRLHAVVPDEVGLSDFGRRDSYIERQLSRWHRQLHGSNPTDEATVRALDEVYELLRARVPAQRYGGIVHGDFRLGNLMVSEAGQVRAVLDWELATTGDTLADLGWLLRTWTEPEEPADGFISSPTRTPGFPRRRELVERYAATSGHDVGDIDYYVAFSHWRSSCIAAGVVHRYVSQVMGAIDFDVEVMRRSMGQSALSALEILSSGHRA